MVRWASECSSSQLTHSSSHTGSVVPLPHTHVMGPRTVGSRSTSRWPHHTRMPMAINSTVSQVLTMIMPSAMVLVTTSNYASGLPVYPPHDGLDPDDDFDNYLASISVSASGTTTSSTALHTQLE